MSALPVRMPKSILSCWEKTGSVLQKGEPGTRIEDPAASCRESSTIRYMTHFIYGSKETVHQAFW
jgi:hypothetical protein